MENLSSLLSIIEIHIFPMRENIFSSRNNVDCDLFVVSFKRRKRYHLLFILPFIGKDISKMFDKSLYKDISIFKNKRSF